MFSKEMKKCEQVISFMSSKVDTFVAELEGKQRVIDECPAETPTERAWLSGAMGSADRVRDEIAYFNGRLEQQRTKLSSLQALDINGQIAFNESAAFSLSKKLNLARRHGTPTSGINAELDEVLDELQLMYANRRDQRLIDAAEALRLGQQRQREYAEKIRQERLASPDFQAEVTNNFTATMTALEGRKIKKGKKRRYVAKGEKRNQPQQPRKDNQRRKQGKAA